MYNTDGKENTEDEDEDDGDVKDIHLVIWYIGSSNYISAVRDTTSSPVVDVICSLYPKTHPLV
jgi:hypothetical protein